MTGTDAAVLALHYQNDVLHPDGKIRVGLDADGPARQRLLDNAAALLAGARAQALPIVHVRIAFRPDYADLLPNCQIFRSVAAIGAVPEGQWGSAFYEGLQPLAGSAREFVVKHTRISAFYGTPLEETLRLLGARRLVVAGVATHSVVEGTVRHAADIGFSVMVAQDACASADPAVHAASLASMRLIAQTGTVDEALRWAAAPN
ncbi:cysteine hydrolase family protein [Achromobacter sp. NFACC18-2]|uniref:cysteine hydrolase family protein n=1 Tax=Achromobacter sp. NFACC18-2 TaxID=1564112 RepID=UPI0008B9D46E|nr:cysteine hydrolase [Achromobacter sp. NFACC18-2]SEJ53952.1 Nicotinamidase-related amidase [Achromobacter sp. NFACC18-2]